MDLGDNPDALHASSIDQTIEELQRMVREHEDALQKLRSSSKGTEAPLPTEGPFQIMRTAYDELAASTPLLPFPESVLPALLALRKTHQTVAETRELLASQDGTLETAKRRLEAEQSNLRDQEALNQSLENRIQSLRDGLESRMEMGPEDIARERISELKQKKRDYDKGTSRLLKGLRSFINQHLASKLAAEELGGPVVGELMEIDSEDLVAGFNNQGRLKKARGDPDEDQRQRRIDEIWGHEEEAQPRRKSKGVRDESTAAATEMQDLTEELLNRSIESEGDSSTPYVQLSRESAAARYLVRSKVAQFHPKDSTKIRLVDFGRELDE